MKMVSVAVLLLLLWAGVQAASGAGGYNFVTKWGSEGTGENQFEWPTGVAVDADGYVYVSDYQNDRCVKFTGTGTYIGTPVDGSNGYMSGVAADSRGFLYLTFVDLVFNDEVDNRPPGDVYVYSDTGWFIDQGSWTRCAAIGPNCDHFYYLDRPSSVAVVPNDALSGFPFCSVYVTDLEKDCVAMFAFNYDSNTMTFVRSWGQAGSLIGQFSDPEGIAAAPDGTLYVADTGNHRIQKFQADGTFIGKWGRNGGDGTAGAGDGEFNRPKGVAVDGDGNVYVADSDNHRVQKFTADGTFVAKWGSEGTADGQFRNPRGIAVDGEGAVYVVDQLNNRVQKFAPALRPDFTAVPRLGDAPLTVTFTDATTGGTPASWLWRFGDGNTSTLQNPTHTYSAGNYAVTLTVSSPDQGTSSRMKLFWITVYAPLEPNFYATPHAGFAPLAVQFTDTTPGGPHATLWQFGDGATSLLPNPVHVYESAGTYTVTLSVDNTGPSGPWSRSKKNYITVIPLTNGLYRVEAEDYDEGGEGIAYHDTTRGNSGVPYRTDDVDIKEIATGKYAVTDTAEGEWTRYTVLSVKSGVFTYPLTLRVLPSAMGRSIEILVNGERVRTVTARPGLGGFVSVASEVTLEPGWNQLAFVHHDTSGGAALLDFDYFTLDPDGGVVTVPGGAAQPTDIDNDGLFTDVNGNNRADFADVVLYFNQMTWIAANEPLGAFDYNGNGRIDFADVVWLFTHL